MRTLYVIRHGIAEKPGEDVEDETRELTRKGKDRMKQVAKGLEGAGIGFDVIVTSPLARTVQTADIMKKLCAEGKKIEETDLLKPDASFDELIDYLDGLEGADSVAIVGHEPFLSSFITYCLSGKKSSFIRLKKGGIASLEIEGNIGPGHCALAWLMEPGQLIRL